jgi:hypothetical protein
MHFVVSWDISASGTEWTTLNDRMRANLAPYSWVRPLTTLYVVQVAGQQVWDSILAGLTAVCQANPSKIYFIMTPLMNGGRYNGFLPENLWTEVNQRSQA